jgi:pimeloyl-ACP methyl ester carboxylesterase
MTLLETGADSVYRTGAGSIPIPEVLIISGTGAPPFGLEIFYGGMIGIFHKAGHTTHVRNIYHMGIGRLDRALEELEKCYFSSDDNRRYIVVGHSQGGLLALAIANLYPDRVVGVELFGAPLYGTRLAPVWAPIAAGRAMSSRSRWLHQLRHHENLDPARVHSYFSALDPLVVPWVASFVKDGHNHLLVPRRLKWPMLAVGRKMIGERIDEAEMLHGTGGHLKLISHPAVLESLGVRYAPVRHLELVA